MSKLEDTHILRLTKLVWGALHPPPGRPRILLALTFGAVVQRGKLGLRSIISHSRNADALLISAA